MQIIQFNHKTAANLLKKSVEEYWMRGKDAWLKFTDGSVVCIHAIKPSWQAYVELKKRVGENYGNGFSDNNDTLLYYTSNGEERLFMARGVSIEFNTVYYYYKEQLDSVTREYIPVIEFHYYEKGEEIARNDS